MIDRVWSDAALDLFKARCDAAAAFRQSIFSLGPDLESKESDLLAKLASFTNVNPEPEPQAEFDFRTPVGVGTSSSLHRGQV